jgi:phosphatidylglycerol:prolipoprotein diacylglycerol transferase
MIDKIALEIFGLQIYWYGVVYFLGFLISYFILMNSKKIQNIKKEVLEDIFFYIMVFGIFGGRIFQIFFYNPTYYLENPIKIFYIWEGGMSIYGGLTFSIIALYFMSKKYKFSFLKITDILVIPLILILSFGRITNFINEELLGKIITENLRHPVVLYESFCYLIIFQINFFLDTFKKLKTGSLTIIFILGYSISRFFLEFLKDTPILFIGLNKSQIFCILFFCFGLFLFFKNTNKKTLSFGKKRK